MEEPLFKITTPSGQKIEGYEHPKECKCYVSDHALFNELSGDCKMYCTESIEAEELFNQNPVKLSEITEEMVKSWGYGVQEKVKGKWEIVSSKIGLTVNIKSKCENNTDLSNILLILIEV